MQSGQGCLSEVPMWLNYVWGWSSRWRRGLTNTWLAGFKLYLAILIRGLKLVLGKRTYLQLAPRQGDLRDARKAGRDGRMSAAMEAGEAVRLATPRSGTNC